MDAQLHFVESLDDANDFVRWLGERRPVLGIDTETEGLNWWRDRLRLCQFGDANAAWVLAWDRWPGLALEVLQRYTGQLVMHNAKFDCHMLHQWGGVDLGPYTRIDDTRLMAHILRPIQYTALKTLAKRFVDPHADAAQGVLETAFDKQGWTWATVPTDYPGYWAYAGLDAIYTARLWELFKPQIDAQYPNVYALDLATSALLRKMERRGVVVDRAYAQEQYDHFMAYVIEATQYVKQTYGIIPTSNTKLAAKLQELGFELIKLTAKGNISVDGEVLNAIPHDLAHTSLQVRRMQKIASTYLGNFVSFADGDSKLHPSINPLGAKTGRMSMSRPNLQNLPRDHVGRPEALTVRNCFLPSQDHVLLMADFDQIEQRVMAHYAWSMAGDPGMAQAFAEGGDFFTTMARRIYGDDSIVKKDPRRQMTKNAAYAKGYGAGPAKFAITAGVDVATAAAFLDRYDEMYPGVTRFQREVDRIAHERIASDGDAFVKAPIGRIHIAAKDKLYTLVNYLIQGAAADVLKMKMLELQQAGLEEFMILPVHDEVLFDVPHEQAREVKRVVEAVMPELQMFSVPLTVGVEHHARWGDKYAGVIPPELT